MTYWESATGWIEAKRAKYSASRALLIGITGIDASGKGYLAGRLAAELEGRGLRTALLSVDPWLRLPDERFHPDRPGEYFYEHALRLDEMFERLVLPLRERRSHTLEADYAEETATEYRRHLYQFQDVEVIVLEGIFLLKRAYQDLFDLSFWIDCTFETALKRALARRQEGLSERATIVAYHTIYFPAQRIHFDRDAPCAAASAVLNNDPRLAARMMPEFSIQARRETDESDRCNPWKA